MIKDPLPNNQLTNILFLDIDKIYGSSSYIGELLPNVDYQCCWFNEYPPNLNWDLYQKKIVFVQCCFLDGPDYDLSNFDLVVVIDYEVVNGPTDMYLQSLKKKYSNNNILLIVSAVLCDHPIDYDQIYIRPFFLIRLPQINQFENTNSVNKPKLFDALLGLNKPHRYFIYENMLKHNLLDISLVSILSNNLPNQTPTTMYYSSDLFELESKTAQNLIIQKGGFDSYQTVYDSRKLPMYLISQLVPWTIYQNSYYSIVAESNASHYHFFSEKTAKPLYAKRLFVLFGSPGQLQKLREWGFRTFGSVIDEAYDLESDDLTRYQMAFKQVIRLSQLNPIDVYRQINEIVEHNHKLICNLEYFNEPLKQWIVNKINQL